MITYNVVKEQRKSEIYDNLYNSQIIFIHLFIYSEITLYYQAIIIKILKDKINSKVIEENFTFENNKI